MKILITGSGGFVGKNLVATLENIRDDKDKTFGIDQEIEIFEYDVDTAPEKLDTFTRECDFVFHLAGVNRPKDEKEFMEGNFGFTSLLLDKLKQNRNKAPVLITSSIQAALDNPYGKSKKAGEDLIFSYGKANGIKTCVYRLPNLFGKWCRPNYNSVVATFCHNIAHDLPITVNDRSILMNLVYIDDVVGELINALKGRENRRDEYCYVPTVYTITLGKIADLIYSFKASRKERSIPDMSDAFTKKLYSTYLSYLPVDEFSYPLKMNVDERGSFTEIIRTIDRGQVSVNISKPGIKKGNHWHHTKNEKFVVVSGRGVIRFRKPGDDEIIEYFVSGDKIEVVDIPTGYTHNIENLGTGDMVTIMWCNECFDPDKPDTYFLEV
ncbi:MAG: capsular polysaccharide biosynthesis protein CapF [Firmicutes bacterium]|nr:capsular polysaccharide biosynthesis protein CapF [Bacillota bacterium]